jgi:CRP-like cAMP-binding protein
LKKTIFFRTPEDAEEFYGLTSSLVEARALETKQTNGVPISSPNLSISDHPANPSPPEHDEELKGLLLQHAKRMDMRKGEMLMEEGDLYQRIYTILSGEIHAVRGNVTFGVMREGEVIGYVLSPFY